MDDFIIRVISKYIAERPDLREDYLQEARLKILEVKQQKGEVSDSYLATAIINRILDVRQQQGQLLNVPRRTVALLEASGRTVPEFKQSNLSEEIPDSNPFDLIDLDDQLKTHLSERDFKLVELYRAGYKPSEMIRDHNYTWREIYGFQERISSLLQKRVYEGYDPVQVKSKPLHQAREEELGLPKMCP